MGAIDPMTSLTDALEAHLPGWRVDGSASLEGGASAALTALDVEDPAGSRRRLVWRRQGPQGPLSIPADLEAETVRAARAAGVPTPEVITWFLDDPELGSGYLMEHLAGETLPRRILRSLADSGAAGPLAESVAQALADVHRTAAPAGLPARGGRDQLDALEAMYRQIGWPVPTFEIAFSWLRERLPEERPSTLVHGDFRLGNLMIDADRLVAVLDWELAHVGDPLEDLGWLCAPAWRFGADREAGGLATRSDFQAAYAQAAGTELDRRAVHFWEVLATLKWGVICQFQSSRSASAASQALEGLLIGRRVSESELDLLQQMEESR